MNDEIDGVRAAVRIPHILHNDVQVRAAGEMTQSAHRPLLVSNQSNHMNAGTRGLVEVNECLQHIRWHKSVGAGYQNRLSEQSVPGEAGRDDFP
jgi:hypothetical protein